MHFKIDFYWNFLRSGLRKWSENSMFFGALSKKLILWKSLFSLRKIAIFLVSSFQKSIKFRCQNAFENDIEKKGSQIEFGHRFGPPKTIKMGPKSDVKRSLFRDAMQITRESSEVNGSHSFWTTNMATHMIRSTLSIYLSIYWSAPRRPNHQSKVCNLTCSTHITAQWTKESKNIVQRH